LPAMRASGVRAPPGVEVGPGDAAGTAGALVARGGGSPEATAAGTEGDDGALEAPPETMGLGARGHAGMVPVGIRSGLRGTDPGNPLPGDRGPAADVVGRLTGAGVPVAGEPCPVLGRAVPPVVAGRGPGRGVRTGGGARSKPGPGRGIGVSIGMGVIDPEAVGGSSLTVSGVRRGGVGGGWRRSSGSSLLRIGGGGRAGSEPGSQAVQSPCGGNSAPHLRHLDTAA